jgi:serine/threonine protein kinase
MLALPLLVHASTSAARATTAWDARRAGSLEPTAMTNPGVPPPPTPPGLVSVGDVVADRYRIEAVLGEGGMGIVYRVQHLHLRKLYALKVLLPLWSSMPEVVARFEREAVAVGRIQDPHIAVATDFGRLPNGSFFLVMEYVKGRTLREVVAGGPLETSRALHIVRGIVAALHATHAVGIVHRDMKPENVMLIERDGDPDFAKVLDFGIAKVDGVGAGDHGGTSNVLTQVGAVIGTPEYMAPEQAMGQSVDARSDFYSVGVILFEMLTGRAPFSGGAVTVLRQHVLSDVPELSADVAAGIDPRISAILRRLLAKLPENRFASTVELMAALDELPQDRELPERPSSTRTSLAAVEGMATPIAQRVRRSLLAGLLAMEGAARRSIDDPRVLLEYVTRRRLAIAGIVSTGLGTMIILLVLWAGTRATPSVVVGQSTTDSTPSPTVASPSATTTAPQAALRSRTAASSYAHFPPSPSPSAAVKPAAPATTAPAAKRPSSFLPSPTPSSPPNDPCNPPYRLDFFGNKVPKPGCP